MSMDIETTSSALQGVVPSICDAEAGHEMRIVRAISNSQLPRGDLPSASQDEGKHNLPVQTLRTLMMEVCTAIRSALDDERASAEDSLRRASVILEEMGVRDQPATAQVRGGLAPWQVRKVTSYVDAHLDASIRNDDLAALVRLNPSHFGRAFRNSFGEPPHEFVIRRRVERAQGLMLSTDASLTDIALDCGLADQSHLTRLFRRIVGESPRAWRRARITVPAECA
jgi:AraC family transcriptional regulator